MLDDKDIGAVVEALKGRVSRWLPCDLGGPRGATALKLASILRQHGIPGESRCFPSPAQAYAYARGEAKEDDRILVFGSFLTVADAMRGSP